jgi:DNA-binding IclR family transcriptional regulator
MQDKSGEAIRRTLLMLKAVSAFNGRWFGVHDIALVTKLAPSTAHRYLRVFVEEKILDYESATSKYQAMSKKRQSYVSPKND